MRLLLFLAGISFCLTVGLAWMLFLPVGAWLSASKNPGRTTFSVVNLLIVVLAGVTVALIGTWMLTDEDIFPTELLTWGMWLGAAGGTVYARVKTMQTWHASAICQSRERQTRWRI